MDPSTRQRIEVILGIIILGIGVFFSLAPFLMNIPYEKEAWLGLAAIYLVTAIFLGGFHLTRLGQGVTLRYSVAVAVFATLISFALQVWVVQTARPETPITDIGLILIQWQILLPFIIAFMTPLGVARARNSKIVVLVAMLTSVVVAINVALMSNSASSFVVTFYLFVLIVGSIAGTPLYLYGRILRDDNP